MKLGRKVSGGRYKAHRKKKPYETAGQARIVKLSEKDKRKKQRTLGGNIKTVMLNAKLVNITISKGKNPKTKRGEIKNVIETPSNRFLARQNIITKGTIVETTAGEKVRITSRPSQQGVVNGILIE